jgi:hypothetical protein
MCKHEWNKFSRATRCIECGKYIDENGKVSADRPTLIKYKKEYGVWVRGQKK